MSVESTINQINELQCVIEANSADVVNSIDAATDGGETTKVRLSVIEESLFYRLRSRKPLRRSRWVVG